jgi:hypothetical protein
MPTSNSTDLRTDIDTFASARPELQKFEDLALALLSRPELSPVKGSVLVAKEALHTARLAVLEAGEGMRAAVESKAAGAAGWGHE